jgi:excisionase family DNA binding protein
MSATHTHQQQFSIQQLAARWAVHPLTVRRRIKRGEIKALRLGRQIVRIELAEVERIEKEARC